MRVGFINSRAISVRFNVMGVSRADVCVCMCVGEVLGLECTLRQAL